jgi:type IV pilus assembly protein PilY1
MKHIFSRLMFAGVGLLSASLVAWAQGTDSTYSSTKLGVFPPNIGYGIGGPMMMLAASRDHTLFSPIYTDYEDIDGDGTDDYTFKPTFRYYGYFDASKCYSYNAARAVPRFEPAVDAVKVAQGSATLLTCPVAGRYWSGNFLNWATMTRIDVVRKTLYGGFRREDTLTETTLEMAQMSFDAHSFVKYYSGADVRSYTPFDAASDLGNAGLTMCSRGSIHRDPSANDPGYPMIRVAKGNYSLWATTPATVCNWAEEQSGFSFGNKATAFYRKYGPAQGAAVDATAHRAALPSRASNGALYDGIGPEMAVRVQVCKAGSIGDERCNAYNDPQDATAALTYKPIGLLQEFGTTFESSQAAQAEFGLITGSYDSNLRGGALRKNIGSMNDEVDFATGRFCHNIISKLPANCKTPKGDPTAAEGAARVGIVKAFDSVRLFNPGNYNATVSSSSGFVLPQEIKNGELASWGNPMSEMVVQALSYFSGQSLGLIGNERWSRDKQVGLPAGLTPSDPLNDTVVDPVARLSRSELYGKGICRRMSTLAISSGSVSYDTDEPGSADDVYDQASGFMAVNGSTSTLAIRTDDIGRFEGINGTLRSVGSAAGGFGVDCKGKTIGAGSSIGTVYSAGLSAVAGVCPEAPGVKGSYLGAGAAFLANTRAIRELGGGASPSALTTATGASVSRSRLPAHALRVKSYAATLAGGVARIEVPIPGSGGGKVFITPESSWNHLALKGKLMPGAMLTFKALYVTSSSGAYVVTWNDAQFGGDYDMDMVGFLRWEIRPRAGSPGASDLIVMTDVLNHNAGAQGAHGFSIIGTKSGDGRYLTHGSNGYAAPDSDCASFKQSSVDFALRCSFDDRGFFTGRGHDGYNWPTSILGGSGNVGFVDELAPGRFTTTVVKTFEVDNGRTNVTLRDPLWYIAKYGSFETGETDFAASTSVRPEDSAGGKPINWDRINNSGQACADGNCADGEPDGYFLARRPELFEARLRTLFEQITQASNTAPSVSSSQLTAGSFKYVAEFSRDSFGGNILGYTLGKDGQFVADKDWNASANLAKQSARQIITNVGRDGRPFVWASVSNEEDADQKNYLTAVLGVDALTTLTDAQRARVRDLIGYMRGDTTQAGKLFRVRSKEGPMGPIVNSTPWLQDTSVGARYTDADFPDGSPSYRSFVIDKAKAPSLLWVGANDGMLHGLNALTGQPVLSYVPSPLLSRLTTALSVANKETTALMDGSPFVADVMVGSGNTRRWASYLFSSLGRGGKAVFALDVSRGSSLALNESRAADVFKWVFTAADDNDLGFQLVDPVRHNASGQASQVVYLNNGEFGLLLPNGHRSANGRPALFILLADGPGAAGWKTASGNPVGYRKLLTRDDSGNGLMGVTWVDLDNNGTADVVYGTDLKGSLWKFDIRSANPQEWGSALIGSVTTTASNGSTTSVRGAKPLFTAVRANGQALPITTAPVAYSPSFGGTMISFGTGRSLESGDFPDTSTVQRFYTVWDKGRYAEDVIYPVPRDGTANPLPSVNATRAVSGVTSNTFMRRVLRRDPTTEQVYQIQLNADGTPKLDANGAEMRVSLGLNDATRRFDPAVHDGWYMEFPSAGEAVLSSPARRLNFVYFTTVRPLSAAEGADSCTIAPRGSLFAFDPINGLPVRGLLQGGEMLMGLSTGADQKVIVVTNSSSRYRLPCTPGTAGCVRDAEGNWTREDPPPCPPGQVLGSGLGGAGGTSQPLCSSVSNLRLQWREIPGMRTR